MPNYIAFNLEGTLTPEDSARDLMGLVPNGRQIFEVLGRYNNSPTAGSREGDEPGGIPLLVAPFLILYSVSESDIGGLAAKAHFVSGATDLASKLEYAVWKIFCVTDAYEQYAIHLTHKLDIYAQRVACTPFPLDKLRAMLSKEEADLLRQLESETLALYAAGDDQRIKQRLDYLYREKLPSTEVGRAVTQMKPVGGRRKAEALNRFANQNSQPLSKWVVVGSIASDAPMLQAVEQAGGLAVALNADRSCLEVATVGLASVNIFDLMELLQGWASGQRKAAERFARERERIGGKENRGYFHWLPGRKDLQPVIELHGRMKGVVRELSKQGDS